MQLQAQYLHEVLEPSPPFDQASRTRRSDMQHQLLQMYAKCVTQGDTAVAQRQLKLHLREHIAWERETVWRTMIEHERRGDGGLPRSVAIAVPEENGVVVKTPIGKLRFSRRHIWVTVSVLAFLTLLKVQTVEDDAANRCFAILIFATILWATEVRHN